MATKKKWSDLTPTQQKLVIVTGAVEAALTTYALRDLASRPDAAVRGPKLAWRLATLVQPFGPVVYLVAGRR
jgi:hypothetical protein